VPIQHAKKTVAISEDGSTKEAILKHLGDLSSLEVFYDQVLVATRPRPRQGTLGGVKWYQPDDAIQEDAYQSKVGLVVMMGPTAFEDDAELTYDGQRVDVGDWIVYTVKDGAQLIINDVHCRLLSPRHVRMRLSNPDTVTF
jgi:co-chaperonin GroES (HSP10)